MTTSTFPLRIALLAALVAAPPTTAHAEEPGGISGHTSNADQVGEAYTVRVDGVKRKYILYVSTGTALESKSKRPVPLVLVLHGQGGTAKGMEASTGWNEVAEDEEFLVAYLQGTKGPSGDSGWNSGITPNLNITADDVKFVRKAVAKISETYEVDRARIYAVGFSHGGFMAHKLASELPDVLAAAGVVAGTIATRSTADDPYIYTTPPKGALSVAIFHSKEDDKVLYKGGLGVEGLDVVPVAESVTRWKNANACTGAPVKTVVVPKKVVTTRHQNCAGNSEVLLYTLTEGGHVWPTVNKVGISAAEELWKFFDSHAKKVITTLPKPTAQMQ